MSVMKGLIRHDRQTLQDYFAETGKRLMLHRTNHFNATGRLHADLVPFLWPSSNKSSAFWEWVRGRNMREADLWPNDVVRSAIDLEQAIQLLVGFELMVKSREDNAYLVPGALPPSKTQVFTDSDRYMLDTKCTFSALPPGAFQRIVVRIAGQAADWCDFGVDTAIFYYLGNIAALTLKWKETAELSWRSSGKALHTVIADAVVYVTRFFPGLVRLSRSDSLSPTLREPIQVLIVSLHGEEAQLVENSVKASDMGLNLVVERQMIVSLQLPMVDLKRIRVVLMCVSAEFTSSKASYDQVIEHVRAGNGYLIPVLLKGCNIEEVQGLHGVPFIDLRGYSSRRKQVEADLKVHVYDQIDKEDKERKKSHNLWEEHRRKLWEEQKREKERKERHGFHMPPFKPQPFKLTSNREKAERLQVKVEAYMKRQDQDAAAAMRDGMYSLVIPALRAWRTTHEGRIIGYGSQGSLECGHGQPKCGHIFDRSDCLNLLQRYEEMHEIINTADWPFANPIIACPSCNHHHQIRDLIALPEVRPCPSCKKPGIFEARECRLQMVEEHWKRIYLVQCRACNEHLSLLDVFPPEVYVSWQLTASDTENAISSLIKQVEIDADVLVWMTKGGDAGRQWEASSGLAASRAYIIMVLLSEEYVASKRCAAELREAVRAGKHIIPILLPVLNCGPEPIPKTFERRASVTEVELLWQQIAKYRRQLGLVDEIEWELLGHRAPIFMPDLRIMGIERETESVICDIVSQIRSLLHRSVKLDIFSDLSRSGVRLSYLKVFVDMCGGRDKLKGKTTDEVMEEYVKPPTAKTKLSWCDYLMSEGDGGKYVATAEVFLSHAWKYAFLDVVDAVQRHFKDSGEDPSIWFDIWSVSQHKSSSRDFNWWQSTFLNAIGAMGRVLMVMLPWDCPKTLTRVWCIFEAYSCEATQSRFIVTMTEEESKKLVAEICRNPVSLLKTLSSVSCEASEARDLKDRDQIFEVIRQSVRFSELDSMVSLKVEEAVYRELKSLFEAALSVSKIEEAIQLGLALGNLCRLKRNHKCAEQHFRDCLALTSSHMEERTACVLCSSLGLAVALSRLGRREDAVRQYELCSVLMKGTTPFKDFELIELEVISGLAVEYQAVGQKEAFEYLVTDDFAAKCRSLLCKSALYNLGLVRLAQQKANDAEDLFLECLGAEKDEFFLNSAYEARNNLRTACMEGLWHPDKLDALAGMSLALEMQGRGHEAERLWRQLLMLRERFLGPMHFDTCETRDRISAIVRTTQIVVPFTPLVPNVQNGTEESHTINGLKVDCRHVRDVLAGMVELFSGLNELQLQRVPDVAMHTCALIAAGGIYSHLRALDFRCSRLSIFEEKVCYENNFYHSGSKFDDEGQAVMARALENLAMSLEILDLRCNFCLTIPKLLAFVVKFSTQQQSVCQNVPYRNI